jgi:hypothetical protein
MSERKNIPWCHGEKMAPTYRYLGKDGNLWTTYRCMYCHSKQEVKDQ